MNPTFRHVDLSPCGPGITRLHHLTVRVWVKSAKMERWRQLLELSLSLTSLHYLAKNVCPSHTPTTKDRKAPTNTPSHQLDDLQTPLPQNTLLFHLPSGIYTTFTPSSPLPAAPSRTHSTRTLPTASFDALLRLAKLDDSVQDALLTRQQLASDLEALLNTNREALAQRDQVAQAADALKTIEYAAHTVRKQLAKAQQRQAEKRDSLSKRRDLMTSDISARATASKTLLTLRPELRSLRSEHEGPKRKAIAAQRRRVCEDLLLCYPILPVQGGKSLSFAIRGVHLPNTDNLDDVSAESVAAALGYTAHVVQLLAFYLQQILPYPLQPRGSTSSIIDPISLLKSGSSGSKYLRPASTKQQDENEDERLKLRTYPLYSQGVPRFRFEYAVFLLNKDAQILLGSAFGTRVLDVRQTLANVKLAGFVATAGEGELPGRKAGGVKGLEQVGEESGGMEGEGMKGVEGKGVGEDGMEGALETLLWQGGEVKTKGAVESLRRNMGKAK